jgi:glycosyltransferase involved in cell wall biosynthesis
MFLRKNKNRKKPLISIITVVYNGEKYIEQTIKSVLGQNFKNFEYIIVDGKSTDSTMDIVKKYKNKIDIIISQKDKNLWDAVNKGIKLSNGQIIGWISSDDTYTTNALKIVFNYFNNNKKIDFLFGSVKKNDWVNKNKKKIYHGFHPKKIFYKFNIYPSTSAGFFIKKKSHLKLGLYDTNLYHLSDYDLFYRMIAKHNMRGMATKKNELIANFRPGGLSETLHWFKGLLIESKIRIKNKQNFIFVLILFILHFINRFKNKIF